MAYDKTHKKDYFQLNVKLDYERDADVIDYMQHVPNKHDVLLKAMRQHLACEACPECYCYNDKFLRYLEEVKE